jgi:ParB family chromosome partitioning protein
VARRSMVKPASLSPGTVVLPVEDIVPDPNQPRKTFPADELGNLAKSLSETGQISPIVVRPEAEGRYMIVVGERRWRAARDAGISHVECIVRHDLDEQKAREMQFAENYQREDVPPLEQARSWKAYLDKYKVSQRELSRRTGIPQRTISDRLALLSLPMSVHAQIEAGAIGPGEAVKIATLPADQQEAVAEAVSSERIGGRMLEKLAKLARAAPGKPIQDIINELASPGAMAVSPAETTDLSATKPVPALHDEIPQRRSKQALKEPPKDEVTLEQLDRRVEALENTISKLLIHLDGWLDEQLGSSPVLQQRCPNCAENGVEYWTWFRKEKVPVPIEERENPDEEEELEIEILYCNRCGWTWRPRLFWDLTHRT